MNELKEVTPETRKIMLPTWFKGIGKIALKDNRMLLDKVNLEVSDTDMVVWASDTHNIAVVRLRRSECGFYPVLYPDLEPRENVRKYLIDPKDFAKLCSGSIYSFVTEGKELYLQSEDSGNLTKIEETDRSLKWQRALKNCWAYINKRKEGVFLYPCYELTRGCTRELWEKLRKIKKSDRKNFDKYRVAFLPDARYIAVYNIYDNELADAHKIWLPTRTAMNNRPVICVANDLFIAAQTATKKEVDCGLSITAAEGELYNLDFGSGDNLNMLNAVGFGERDYNNKLVKFCECELTKTLVVESLEGISLYDWNNGIKTLEMPETIYSLIKDELDEIGAEYDSLYYGLRIEGMGTDEIISTLGLDCE